MARKPVRDPDNNQRPVALWVIVAIALIALGLAFDHMMRADAARMCAHDGPQASEAVCRQGGVIR